MGHGIVIWSTTKTLRMAATTSASAMVLGVQCWWVSSCGRFLLRDANVRRDSIAINSIAVERRAAWEKRALCFVRFGQRLKDEAADVFRCRRSRLWREKHPRMFCEGYIVYIIIDWRSYQTLRLWLLRASDHSCWRAKYCSLFIMIVLLCCWWLLVAAGGCRLW